MTPSMPKMVPETFSPEKIAEYIKPRTPEEIAAMTPQEQQARLGVLKMIQNGLMTPKQIKAQKRKSKFSARLQQRLNSPK
jgi:uncharacterized membrane protein